MKNVVIDPKYARVKNHWRWLMPWHGKMNMVIIRNDISMIDMNVIIVLFDRSAVMIGLIRVKAEFTVHLGLIRSFSICCFKIKFTRNNYISDSRLSSRCLGDRHENKKNSIGNDRHETYRYLELFN